jgi:hypothetical protein
MYYLTKAGVKFLNEMGSEAREYRRLKSSGGSGKQLDQTYRTIPRTEKRSAERREQYRQYVYKGGISKDVAKEGDSPRVIRKMARLGRQVNNLGQ